MAPFATVETTLRSMFMVVRIHYPIIVIKAADKHYCQVSKVENDNFSTLNSPAIAIDRVRLPANVSLVEQSQLF